MKYISSLFLTLVCMYLFLVSPRIFGKPDKSQFYGVHYAHRGLFDNDTDAPENSLNAFRKAVEHGYGIEFDVQLSKDNIPVVFHDATLKRMCGVKGNVWDYTLEELQQMKLKDSDQTIPTLEQVLEVIGGKVPLIIEYKMDVVSTKVCELANDILLNYEGLYCIESFHPWAVKWYKDNRPDIVRGQLSADYSTEPEKYKGIQFWVMKNLLTNFLTRPDFIAYNYEHSYVFSRKVCSSLGAMPVAWTIRSQEAYESAKDQYQLFIFDSCIPVDNEEI